MKRVMKAAVVLAVAAVIAALFGLSAHLGYIMGRQSMDQTLYCGEYTQAYTTDSGEHLNGCELLPGYKAVRS